jgi:hypothetical protein
MIGTKYSPRVTLRSTARKTCPAAAGQVAASQVISARSWPWTHGMTSPGWRSGGQPVPRSRATSPSPHRDLVAAQIAPGRKITTGRPRDAVRPWERAVPGQLVSILPPLAPITYHSASCSGPAVTQPDSQELDSR